MSKAPSDYAVRAITDDGSFRVIVARTTQTVREVAKAQDVKAPLAETFGELLTATVLFRETMSPGLRVQGILKGKEGKATLVADSAPEGKTRGLVQLKNASDDHAADLGEGALLQMMRTLNNGAVNQGIVRVPEGGGVSSAMMAYMQESEQVDTMLAVATTLNADGSVQAAAGYMVQLLPELGRGPLAIMAERLEDFRTIGHLLVDGFTPESLRDELLYGMPFTALDHAGIMASCWCSESRLLGALATLDRSEIQSMIDDGTPLEITCDYCRKDYVIPSAKLSGLLMNS